MNKSLRIGYEHRWIALTVAGFFLTIVLWLAVTDVAFQFGVRGINSFAQPLLLGDLSMSGALNGIFGVQSMTRRAYLVAAIFGLGIIVLTQLLVLRPRRQWTRGIFPRTGLDRMTRAILSIVAAMLIVGPAMWLVELTPWQTLGSQYAFVKLPGRVVYRLHPLFWFAAAFFTLAWTVIFMLLPRWWRDGPYFERLGRVTYLLFVVSSAQLLVAGAFQIDEHRFNPDHGSYTTAMLGLIVMLWSLLPALWLLFASQDYFRRKLGQCLGCGYDLRELTGHACPECGRGFGTSET